MVKLKGLLNLENLLIVGDLNFIVLETEFWGDSSRVDPLERYFTNLMLLSHLVDIAPARLGPTWCNGLVGSVGIGKRLDRFLVAECLLPHLSQHRVWSRPSKIFDRFPICLEWREVGSIPPYLFKFNQSWLQDVDFNIFVHQAWLGDSTARGNGVI